MQCFFWDNDIVYLLVTLGFHSWQDKETNQISPMSCLSPKGYYAEIVPNINGVARLWIFFYTSLSVGLRFYVIYELEQ